MNKHTPTARVREVVVDEKLGEKAGDKKDEKAR